VSSFSMAHQHKIGHSVPVCLAHLVDRQQDPDVVFLAKFATIYTLCPKKAFPTFLSVIQNQLTDFDNFWYKYFWHNLPSNDHSVSHLTQRLFLHYLGKHNQWNITFYPMRYNCLINITSKNTFCSHFWHWLTFHPVVHFSTACSKIAWSVGPLCEHRQEDAFSIHWQQYQ